jgi:AraC-like DNA-binding protein
MTFYHEQITKLNNELYPKDYLVKQVEKAKRFIDKNFARNIELKEIAGEAFFSKFHFIRLFKKIYGRTPYQYLTTVRIEKTKRLLQKGQAVTAVCFSVGFDSVSSFSGLFQKSTGCTPSAFIKKIKGGSSKTLPLYSKKFQ